MSAIKLSESSIHRAVEAKPEIRAYVERLKELDTNNDGELELHEGKYFSGTDALGIPPPTMHQFDGCRSNTLIAHARPWSIASCHWVFVGSLKLARFNPETHCMHLRLSLSPPPQATFV